MTANEQKFPVSKPALSVCADGSELPLELVAALQLLADAGGSVTIGSIHLAADEIRMVAQAAQGGTNFCLLRTRLTDPVAAITESGRAGGYKLVFNRCEGGEVIVRLQSKKKRLGESRAERRAIYSQWECAVETDRLKSC